MCDDWYSGVYGGACFGTPIVSRLRPASSPPRVAVKPARPKVRQKVIWLESRKWGGKQNTPAVYLHSVGTKSARIELADKSEKIVRLSSLRWS